MLLAERLRKPEERAEVQQALSLLIKQVTLTLALTLILPLPLPLTLTLTLTLSRTLILTLPITLWRSRPRPRSRSYARRSSTPHISPTSPLHLAYISPRSRLYLP